MALRSARYLNQYDFSGGIRLDAPPHLIEDIEVFANISSYDGTINCYWNAGLRKRKGTEKVNSCPGYDTVKFGDCEEATAPVLSADSVALAPTNATWARSSTFSHTGTYSYKLTKTSAVDGGTAIAYFNDGIAINDLHYLKANRNYYIETYLKTNADSVGHVCINAHEYYLAGWHTTSIFTTGDTWTKVSSNFTTNALTAAIYFTLELHSHEATNKFVYADDFKIIDVADYITSGIRFYRSIAPTETTIVAASYADETKIFYLDGTALKEITGGTVIPTATICEFAPWKDCLYIATGSTYIQKISYDSGWVKENLAVVPTSTSWKPAHIYQHRDRLFIAGGDMPCGYAEGSALESDISFAGDSLDGASYYFGYLDGDPITRLISFQNNLMVYKKDSIHALEGDNATNWFATKVQNTIGCTAPNSVVDIGFGQIFLSADNIYFFDGSAVYAIGNKVRPWLYAIPFNMRPLAAAAYHNNYYRISFAKSSTTTHNDFELILDIPLFRQGRMSTWGANPEGKLSWWANS
jgi:hypothetical protein